MVSVIVRRNSVDQSVQAETVEELFTRVAEQFNVTDPSTIRLVHRGRIIQPTDNISDLHIEDGSVILMTTSIPPPSRDSNTGNNSSAPPENNIRDVPQEIGNIISRLINGLGAAATVVVHDGTTTTVSGGLDGIPAGIPQAQPTTQPPTVEGVPLASTAGARTRRPAYGPFVLPRSHTSPQTAPPPIAGVYLHVHCNLDELDSVPERLERMQRRIPHVSMQAHYPGQPGEVPPPPLPRRTPNASADAAPTTRMENGIAPGRTVSDAVSGLAQHGQSHVDRNSVPQPSHLSSGATDRRDTQSHVDPTSNDAVGSQEENGASEDHSYVTTSDLLSRLLSAVPIFQLLPLLSGNWAVLYPLREAFRSLREEYGNGLNEETFTNDLYDSIFQTANATQIIAQHGNPAYPYEQVLRPWMQQFVQRVMHQIDADGEAQVWGTQLRSEVVRGLGGISHFSSHWLSGLSPLVQILNAAFEAHADSLPSIAPFLPMVRNMLSSSLSANLQSWGNEYRDHFQQQGDGVLFQPDDSGNRAPLRQEATQDSLDDLVNSLLNSDDDSENDNSPQETTQGDRPAVGIPLVQQWAAEIGSNAGVEPLRQVLRVETHNITLPDDDDSLQDSLMSILSAITGARNQRQ